MKRVCRHHGCCCRHHVLVFFFLLLALKYGEADWHPEQQSLLVELLRFRCCLFFFPKSETNKWRIKRLSYVNVIVGCWPTIFPSRHSNSSGNLTGDQSQAGLLFHGKSSMVSLCFFYYCSSSSSMVVGVVDHNGNTF